MIRTLRFLAGLFPGTVSEPCVCGVNDLHIVTRLNAAQALAVKEHRRVPCARHGCTGALRTPEQLATLRRSAATEVRPRTWPDDHDGLVV